MGRLNRHAGLLVNLMLTASAIIFAIGIWAPILTLKKLVFVQSTFSVLSGIAQLARDGEYVLLVIITTFTLVLPCCKIAVLFAAWNRSPRLESHRRYLQWLTWIGKWAMLDVFVVAVFIASVKLRPLATVEIHYGLYLFAAAVILIMIETQLVYKRIKAGPDAV